MHLMLQKHLHAVEHEDAALPRLPYLVAVKQLELAYAFVVVVFDADASFPFLDFSFGSPEPDIYWLGAVENQAGGCNMDTVHIRRS